MTINSRRQIKIPIDALHAAELNVGDRIRARADGSGRIVIERKPDPLEQSFGIATGVYEGFDLDALRRESDRRRGTP